MKRFIVAFLIFLVWFAIAGSFYTFVIKNTNPNTVVENEKQSFPIKKLNKPEVEKELIITQPDTIAQIVEGIKVDSLTTGGLVIKDKHFNIKTYYTNFNIYKNSNKVQIPYRISNYGYVISKHMDSVNSKLIVKGFYNEIENEEIGNERALFIKEKLVSLGILDSLITTKSVPAIFEFENDRFVGGIDFAFEPTTTPFELNNINYSELKNNSLNKSYTKESIPQKNTPEYKIEEKKVINNPKELLKKNDSRPVTAVKTTIENKKITYTVLASNFKNEKFKPNKKFKQFLEANKSAKTISLVGFSNAEANNKTNYNKGIELSKVVNEYIKKKKLYSGPINIDALKNETISKNSLIREGVTLIVK